MPARALHPVVRPTPRLRPARRHRDPLQPRDRPRTHGCAAPWLASRGRHHTGRGCLAGEQICEGSAGLEGTRVPQQLQLKTDLARAEPYISTIDLYDMRASHVTPN